MPQITIAYSNPSNLPQDFIEELKKLGNVKIFHTKHISEKEAVNLLQGTEILIGGTSGFKYLGKEFFEGMKDLKFISIFGVGTDWIDLNEAKKHNVQIAITTGANSEAVAEHIWGMILNLSKRISEIERETRKTGKTDLKNFRGKEIYGKTIGIMGIGNIGEKVVRIAKGFDMKILAFNKSKKDVKGIEFVPKDKLIKESDIITLCLPFSKETENIIDFEEIEKMKDGVILVNCARDKLVNKEAILAGISSGKIYGYGIDADFNENNDYLNHSNILFTPHNAWNTNETNEKYYEIILENVKAFLEGKPINIVE